MKTKLFLFATLRTSGICFTQSPSNIPDIKEKPKMHFPRTAVLFALLVCLAAASASATTINFASLQAKPPDGSVPGALMAGTVYTQAGFAIGSCCAGGFDVWKLGNPNFPGTSSSATSLFEMPIKGNATSITYKNGMPFTLDSIDFAPLLSGGSGPFSIIVAGDFGDGSSITQTVWVNTSPNKLQTFKFTGFINVLAVNFLQGTTAGYFTGQETAYQFNNIVVNNKYVNGVSGNDSNNCLSAQTACKTIGHAISLASSGDSLMVAAATYQEHLTIGISVNVLGAAASTTIVDGGGVATVVSVSAHVTLSGLTIRNGSSSSGGGIYNSGSLAVNNSAITGNHVSACGGGIGNKGTLTINSSTISGNSASMNGGGICQTGGTLTINRSTISGNSASVDGGGISQTGGTLAINNSTISGNGASNAGGGVITQTGGTLTISNGTVSGNSAPLGGGGIDNTGTATLQNSIVANNSGGNCSGSVTSKGYNLDSDSSCNFHNSGDLNTDPMLGTLGKNGGPTQTIPLLAGSPAIDAGNPNGCTDNKGTLLKIDQRGQPRPNKGETGCDMGAYESQN